MDAANFRKLTYILPTLLLSAALALPWTAQAQPQFSVPTTVTVNGSAGANVAIASSDGTTPITFKATPTAWVGINGNNAGVAVTGTTPATINLSTALTFGLGNPATVTLTATSPSGVNPINITVTFTNNTGGGGGGGTGGGSSDILFANPSTISTNTNNGGALQVTLTDSGPDPVSYSVASSQTWLTVTTSNNTVTTGSPATLNLTFNPAGLAAGPNSATITVTNLTATQSLSIPVTYTVSQSTVVTLSPFNGNLGPSSPTVQVSVTAPTQFFNATSNVAWLLLGFAGLSTPQQQLFGISTSTPMIVSYNSSATAPATGATGTVTVTDQNGDQATFTATFNGSSSGGGSGTVTISPNPVTLTSTSGSTPQQNITITSSIAGTVGISLTGNFGNSVTYSFTNGTSTLSAGGSITVTLTGNSTGLSQQTYTGTVTATVTPTSGSQAQGSDQISFVVGSSSTGGGGTASSTPVVPTSLSFSADVNNTASISAQNITVTSTGAYSATAAENSDCGSFSWLSVGSTSGTANGAAAPVQVPVIVNPTGLPIGTCTGSVTVTTTSGNTSVAVSVQVYNGAIIFAQTGTGGGSGSVTLTEISQQITGQVPALYLLSSDHSFKTATAATDVSWLTVTSSGGTLSATNNNGFNLFLAASNLPNGVYIGHVIFTVTGAANSPLSVPVVISVTGSTATSSLGLTQTSITLNGSVGGASATTTLGVTAPSTVAITATATTASGGSWLSINAPANAPGNITVTANPSGLSANTYTGTINVSSNIGTATASVTFVVGTGSTNGGTTITSNAPASGLSFSYTVNGTAPASQSIAISNSVSGTASTSFTVATSVSGNVPNWLTATVGTGGTTGTTPGSITVTVNTSSLSPAQYNGIITVSAGNVLSIPVTLNILSAATVTAISNPLTFQYQVGGTTPSPGQINVSGSASGLTYTASVATTSGGSWLALNKTSGTTPDVLSVSVSPAGLTAGNSYKGTVTVSGSGSASGTTNIPVTLTITAPFPTITSVQNAASFASGSVSPGEIVSIFGTALGPSTPLGTTLDSTGKVSTSLGNVQVLFNGVPAPLTYVSSTQINCVVPYQLAGFTTPFVEVKYLGQPSNAFNLQATATSPGIFTVGNGTGQGAILNGDNSSNAQVAAAAGSVVQLYMTGEGQLSPAGVTGSVTCSAGCASISQIPVPLLKAAALVNNQPATIGFIGEAPGFVSGVLQVNVTIPPNTPSGNIPIVISIGGVNSQANVTVSVK